jgi:two-component system chemotaxis sensor kinase CheA
MSINIENLEKLINGIAAQLPLIEPTDLSGLGRIINDLKSIAAEKELPQAFLTLADRAEKLAGHIIMGETEFGAGCKKLGTSVDKMAKSLAKIPQNSLRSSPESSADADDPAPHDDVESYDDIKDMLMKFAAGQQAVLEDFESYILELEKGDPHAKGAITRILHTWKGEFGVLSLTAYASFIHNVEDRIEAGTCNADMLFRIKDFITSRMTLFAHGDRPQLSDDERRSILGDENRPHAAETIVKPPEPPETAPTQPTATPIDSHSQVIEAFTGDPSMMGDFITESRDHVHTAETLMLELETDPTNTEYIDSIFRSWHTIKGVAGFLNLREINTLAHSMESLVDKVRKKEMLLEPAHIDLLLESNDCLKEFITVVEKTMAGQAYEPPQGYAKLLERLKSPTVKAVDVAVHLSIAPTKKLGEILVDSGSAPAKAVSEAIVQQQQGDERKLGEILIEDHQVPARAVAGALGNQTAARMASTVEETIRVPVNRIDQLVDLIGEAVIAQSMINADRSIAGLGDQTLNTKITHANMVMRQIQEMGMSLRMVSIKSTFQKMARLARDLGKKFDREIDFITDGEDTELDKSVVENIGDPLIHMIRNSIDHGIETREERLAAGKNPRAKVTLKAYHRAGSIYIEVSDDGRGLDKEKIVAKAISRNLCKADERLTDQEIFQFIFLPGFSTAAVVTDVSGRGVGMDVVKRNIETLRGSVEISSEKGFGTTFTIRLPLTLAIVDGMIVRAGNDSYILPTLAIVESIRPAPDQITSVMQKGRAINLRGNLITLVHLESILNNTNGNKWDATEGVVMIVEDMLGKKIGLHVDEIVGQQQVVIKSLGNAMGDVPGVTGGAIMNNGNISLILDISGIMRMAGE